MMGTLAGLLTAWYLYIRMRPGKEILTAIKQNQFYVVYQPVVDASELRVRGVEVLMRWKHPTAGEIPPDAFIQYAEAQQLIVPLTLHLFKLIAHDAPVLQTLLPQGPNWVLISRPAICMLKALLRIFASLPIPFRPTISAWCWKSPSGICCARVRR
jgi:hypothetical protein